MGMREKTQNKNKKTKEKIPCLVALPSPLLRNRAGFGETTKCMSNTMVDRNWD